MEIYMDIYWNYPIRMTFSFVFFHFQHLKIVIFKVLWNIVCLSLNAHMQPWFFPYTPNKHVKSLLGLLHQCEVWLWLQFSTLEHGSHFKEFFAIFKMAATGAKGQICDGAIVKNTFYLPPPRCVPNCVFTKT